MEITQAYQWSVTRAKDDPTLVAVSIGGIWQGNAPLGTSGLYVSITEQSNMDILTMNAFRVFSSILLLIKAVSLSSDFDNLLVAADRIDELFKRQKNIALSPGYMLSSYREQEVSYETLEAGKQYSFLGGLYRVLLQGGEPS
jgi:hypothetical protein